MMKQNMEHEKKKVATRSISFILALVFVFSIFSGTVSIGKIQEENNNISESSTLTPTVSTNVTETTGTTYINITAGEAKQMMGENRRLVILDVRPFAEYKSGHIEGAESLPLSIVLDITI